MSTTHLPTTSTLPSGIAVHPLCQVAPHARQETLKPIVSPMAWEGAQFSEESSFVVQLSPTDIAEVDTALASFQVTGLSAGHLSPLTFVLPTFGPKLRRLSHRVHHEEGFFVLRGLEPWRYKRLKNTIVFTGIASYIGNRRGMQSADGPVITYIFDYSTEVEEMEKSNDGCLGHANRTSAFMTVTSFPSIVFRRQILAGVRFSPRPGPSTIAFSPPAQT
ncbi:Taurine hydroxylase-like protein sat17 [Fusarium falciforme]